MTKSKIFGIGLAKTGTTSLNDAFAILGIASIGCPASISAVKRFDAATDGIVADQFEQLDRAFPNSKFIYTVRERESWLESYTRYHGRKQSSSPGHKDKVKRLYGTTGVDKQTLLDAYDRHESHVHEYFKDRPGDLLVFNICGGQADWESLCAFLGKPIPDTPFPSSNEKFSDNIFLYLLYYLKDTDLISKITRAPVRYLSTLSTQNYDPTDFINEKPTKRSDRILVKTCKYFGSIDKTAEHLQLDKQLLKQAIERHKQRKALRLRRKSTFLEKRVRKLKHLFGLQIR